MSLRPSSVPQAHGAGDPSSLVRGSGSQPVYESVNPVVLARIPAGARSLLDVGCGSGALGAAAKSERELQVTGVTHSAAETGLARLRLDAVVQADLNDFDPQPLGRFDCIVCSHVLEHLADPGTVLRRLRGSLAAGGVLVVALPNVLFWKQRLEFMRGRFRYAEGGLMDRTHLRFFDWCSAAELIEDAGFVIEERIADGGLPLSSRLGQRCSRVLDREAASRFPGLFGFQFVFVCRPRRGAGVEAA